MKKAHQVKQGMCYGMHTSLINFILHCMCHLLCKHDGILKKLKIKSIKEVADNNETLVLSENMSFSLRLSTFDSKYLSKLKMITAKKNALV